MLIPILAFHDRHSVPPLPDVGYTDVVIPVLGFLLHYGVAVVGSSVRTKLTWKGNPVQQKKEATQS